MEGADRREADDAAAAAAAAEERVLSCEDANLLHMVAASAVEECDLRSTSQSLCGF